MKLHSEVQLPDIPIRLDHRKNILMSGSCFTENIGQKIERYAFPVSVNPFGTMFNPLSVKAGLESLVNRQEYTTSDLDQHEGSWFSFDHYTGFSNPDRDACLRKINDSFVIAKNFLAEGSVLILSWGTAWVYRLKEGGRLVSNCHKKPARLFIRSRLTTKEILRAYREVLDQLGRFNPGMKILLTVSPVRHLKDGAHGNQLSKATLLLAAEELVKLYPEKVFYFPSYEIVMDELRDYRYYAADLVHMNELAVAYIWEKVKRSLINEDSLRIMDDMEAYLKLLEHRARDADVKALEQLEQKKESLRKNLLEKYPYLSI